MCISFMRNITSRKFSSSDLWYRVSRILGKARLGKILKKKRKCPWTEEHSTFCSMLQWAGISNKQVRLKYPESLGNVAPLSVPNDEWVGKVSEPLNFFGRFPVHVGLLDSYVMIRIMHLVKSSETPTAKCPSSHFKLNQTPKGHWSWCFS